MRFKILLYPLYLAAVAVAFLLLAEWVFTRLDAADEDLHGELKWDYRRHIRLREQMASVDKAIKPHPDRLAEGSLEDKEYRFRTDEEGFIRPSLVHQAPDLTLVFMGGSTTECLLVDEDKRFPYLVGSLLGERLQLGVNALNAGRSMNHTMHNLNILVNKILPLDADFIFLMNNINDLYIFDAVATHSYWNDHPTRSLLYRPIVEETGPRARFRKYFPYTFLRLFELKNAIWPYVPEPEVAPSSSGAQAVTDVKIATQAYEDDFAAALTSFIGVAKAWNKKVVLMTQASRFIAKPDIAYDNPRMDYESYRALHRRFNDVIRAVAGREGVYLVDLEASIPQSKDFMIDFVHFNNRGSEKAAEVIADSLAGWIGQRRQEM